MTVTIWAIVGFVLFAVSTAASFLGLWLTERLKDRKIRKTTIDRCERCGRPATHELLEVLDTNSWGGSGMVACYCWRHRPDGAVRVR